MAARPEHDFDTVVMKFGGSSVADAEKITPGFNSPTVMSLEDQAWCAVRAMVKLGDVHAVMERLEAIGATAVIETRIGNCRL